jgi:hypothetical protein
LKNAQTRLASLFQVPDAASDAEEIARGPLGGVFERMLFLTATPFQLGHHELCSVLERFDGICWRRACAPVSGRANFKKRLTALRAQLDAAQEASLSFDAAWGKLTVGDLALNGAAVDDAETWRTVVRTAESHSQQVQQVVACYERTGKNLREAEYLLRPWVIRHRRPDTLTGKFEGQLRRRRLPGRSILSGNGAATDSGIEVSEDALLPFLLAARAAVCMPESRPVFAEGLASSYEAFLHTRKARAVLDADTEPVDTGSMNRAAEWYLDQLERSLPTRDLRTSAKHPKVHATAERALQAWRDGEKVVVFCHFIQTGRTLRRIISGRMHEEICLLGGKKLRCSPTRAVVLLANQPPLLRHRLARSECLR